MKSLTLLVLLLNSFALQAAVTYTVPVPAELEAFATFPNLPARYVQEGTQITVSYRLPEELVGNQTTVIALRGEMKNPREFRLKGEHGDARCQSAHQRLNCIVEYKDLPIDERALGLFIEQKFPERVEQLARLEVARLFSGEPIGVITAQVPAYSPAGPVAE